MFLTPKLYGHVPLVEYLNEKQGLTLGNTAQAQLDANTALLAAGHTAVCCFVNDDLSKEVLERLAEVGVKYAYLPPYADLCSLWDLQRDTARPWQTLRQHG